MPKRKKPPELTFHGHIADFLVRERKYGALEQSDITDTESPPSLRPRARSWALNYWTTSSSTGPDASVFWKTEGCKVEVPYSLDTGNVP